MSIESISGDALASQILRLGQSLRRQGVSVALSEMVDATQAASMIDIGSRDELRLALRSTMIKSPLHLGTFDAAFDRFFPRRKASRGRQLPKTPNPAKASTASRLANGDDLLSLATDLVDEHGGLDGDQRGERHHMLRVYRAADLARLMSEARTHDPELSIEDLQARLDELKQLIAADIRGQLDHTETDGSVHDTDVQDIDFLNASRSELDQIQTAIKPLARKLAARLARRRQPRSSGRINLRKTTRRALSTGGVPINLSQDRPKAHRPELIVLCDISGSVAEFSLFTLSLISALSAEIANTRSFVFIDAVDEITQLLEATDHGIGPWQIMRNTKVIGSDGHSDYGAVFEQWWENTGRRELRQTSTVIIAGDARNNYRPDGVGVLRDIASRARRVYWLNPEPMNDWDSNDSIMSTYDEYCDEVFEVQNLRALTACVERIL